MHSAQAYKLPDRCAPRTTCAAPRSQCEESVLVTNRPLIYYVFLYCCISYQYPILTVPAILPVHPHLSEQGPLAWAVTTCREAYAWLTPSMPLPS